MNLSGRRRVGPDARIQSVAASVRRLLPLLICALHLGLTGCSSEPKINDRDVIGISVADLMQLQIDARKPTVLVDPRTPARFATGHLPGAINIPLADATAGDERLPADGHIVVYGATYDDATAVAMAKKLMRLGYPGVRLYRGGIDDWTSRGRDTATASPVEG